jgi:hypothetical protein
LKFYVAYKNSIMEKFESIGPFESVEEAKKCINEHSGYKKSWYTKKGIASFNNPDSSSYFRITDSEGGMWFIK